ncbi:MAG: hypothetical protein WC787_03215 [Patescibacteria group bacterium]|jgi:hypothetical protein
MNLRPHPWLFIDTSVAGAGRVGILDGLTIQVKGIVGRSGALLPAIAKIGSSRLKNVRGVCVVSGPGSFSSVRAGVLIANMLARLLRVPLVGVSVREADDLTNLSDRLSRQDVSPQSFVAPVYDAEPNITMSRA